MKIDKRVLFLKEIGGNLEINSKDYSFQKFFFIFITIVTGIIFYFFYKARMLDQLWFFGIIWIVFIIFITGILFFSNLKIIVSKRGKEIILEDKSFHLFGGGRRIKNFSKGKSRLIIEKYKEKYYISIFDGKDLTKINPVERGIGLGASYFLVESIKGITGNKYLYFTKDQVDKVSQFLDIKTEQRENPTKTL